MTARKRNRRNPRDVVRTVPFRYVDASRGIDVTATTLRYFEVPSATRVTPVPASPRTLLDVKREVALEIAHEYQLAQAYVPPVFRTRERLTPVSPTPVYRPREIAQDATGYVPPASYSRAELLRDVLLAARYA